MAQPTAQDLIEGAMGQRTANDPNRLYSPPEMVGELDRYLMWLYTWVAERNQYYFGKTLVVDPTTGFWAAPSDAIIVWRAESGGAEGTGVDRAVTPTGTQINIVRFEDRFKANIAPRIYPLGNSYFTVAATGDPSGSANGDKIAFYYAKRHPRLDNTKATTDNANTLDASWPAQYNMLPILRLARFLARKDGRSADEIADLKEQHDEVLATFEGEIKVSLTGAATRFSRNPAPSS